MIRQQPFRRTEPEVYGEIPYLDDTKSRTYVCNAISSLVSSLPSGRVQILPGSKAIERKRAGGRRASSSRVFN